MDGDLRVNGSPHDGLAFLPGVAERLGFYVYALRDPRTGRLFYVGKGVGDRVYQHARNAKSNGESMQSAKLATIREIHGAGLEVGVEIIRHGLTEDAAYDVEAGVIDILGLVGIGLTNKVIGKGSTAKGWQPLTELRARYAALPAQFQPNDRIVLIRINKEFRPGLSDEQLYEATRNWWVVNPKRGPTHALAIYNGVVRAAYSIDTWQRAPDGRRWGFIGERDPEAERRFLWHHVNDRLRKGDQNPIRYVGC